MTKKILGYSETQANSPKKRAECNAGDLPPREDKGDNPGELAASDAEKAMLCSKAQNSNNSMDIQENLSTSEDSKSEKMDIIEEHPSHNSFSQAYDPLECHSPCANLIAEGQENQRKFIPYNALEYDTKVLLGPNHYQAH